MRQPQHGVSQGRADSGVDVLEGARGPFDQRREREDGADLRTRQHHPRHAETTRLHPQRHAERGSIKRSDVLCSCAERERESVAKGKGILLVDDNSDPDPLSP